MRVRGQDFGNGNRVFRFKTDFYSKGTAVEWNPKDDFALFPASIATALKARGYASDIDEETVEAYNAALKPAKKESTANKKTDAEDTPDKGGKTAPEAKKPAPAATTKEEPIKTPAWLVNTKKENEDG